MVEKMYVATFPWLEGRVLDVKVKYNCRFLYSIYLQILNSHIPDDEIIAQSFDDGNSINDCRGREKSASHAPGNYEAFDSYQDPCFPRAFLTNTYLSTWPLMGILKPRDLAEHDAFFLQSQSLHFRKKSLSMEEIIMFHGAREWDTWSKQRPHLPLTDWEITVGLDHFAWE